MPIFHDSPNNDTPCVVVRQSYQNHDCGLLHFSPITMYYSREILEEDVEALLEPGYIVRRFDATRWENFPRAFFTDFSQTMGFPEGWGTNLDSMEDCLGDIEIPDAGGVVIAFDSFDQFANSHAELAWNILDIIACKSRLKQIFGETLIALMQSDDPQIRFEAVGASRVFWNQREFFDSSRGL